MTDFETVDTGTEVVADDAQLETLEEQEDTSLSLDEAIEPVEEKPEPQGTSEPGWIRKRVDKAVQKAVAETEARMKAQFDAQMKPFIERQIEQDARELVRQGEFKSVERAKEYLQLKQGITPETQPRNERGQYESKGDPEAKARANILANQAQRIKASKGVDVMAEFNGNEEVKGKVISGEWDFYDVAEYMSKPKRKAPAPMRSPNGASGSERSTIASMSDDQFDRLEKRISEGARYNLK